MSLLEDVFLQDEADEAQDLERIIEGDELDEHPRSDSDNDSVKGEDEAVEEKRRVDPNSTKQPKVVKNPRFVLNPSRLIGPRGIQVIPDHFKDFKFKGKGHEKEDLDMVLKKLEHWAYRLYPKFKFDDCLKKIETLGKKRPVMVHLHKIRSDQYQSEETVVQRDSSDDEAPGTPPPEDEFDRLLQQQIEIARVTPAPNSLKKPNRIPNSDIATPFAMPKATSSPSINDEQRERMLRNRRLAEERRIARLKQNTMDFTVGETVNNKINLATDSDRGNGNEVIVNELNAKAFNSNEDVNMIDQQEKIDIDKSNESVTVDLTKVNENLKSKEKKSIVNLTDSVERENDNKVVDSTDVIVENKVKSRTTDDAMVRSSSDDECDTNAVNHSISVDVHKSNDDDKRDEVLHVSSQNVEELSVNDILNEIEKGVDSNNIEVRNEEHEQVNREIMDVD